jgi:hypothetical protein
VSIVKSQNLSIHVFVLTDHAVYIKVALDALAARPTEPTRLVGGSPATVDGIG